MIPKCKMIELFDAKLVYKAADIGASGDLKPILVDELGFSFDDDRLILYLVKDGGQRELHYRGSYLVYR